ncbi:LAFE_0F15830g1_1 [Lachancea fermentati]|uniref:LAFE_0F15830g1_1 n=1 Tax=Lachancea fermentati TaxID=4955 RepID=A0A1G4MG99_LACFM|nr:LAFE_0F15830g1_1 [Lachancea fermentati]
MISKTQEIVDMEKREPCECPKDSENFSSGDESGNDGNKISVPDGGFGWFVVIAYFFYNFTTWGANAGYAIYLAHYLEYNTFPGGGKLDYAAIGGLAFGCGLIFSPVLTLLTHKTSVQFVIGLGIVLQGAALLLAAFSKKLWQIYLTQGLLISFGLAAICIPSVTLLPQWFRKKRSLAMGLGASGSGLGGIVFNLGMQKMIEVHSVKWALIAQCIICTALSTLALFLTRTRTNEIQSNSKQGSHMFDSEVLRSAGFWLLVLYVCFTMVGYVVLLYSLSAFTVSLGYSENQGSIVSCMISVGALFGRPVVGLIADHFGPVTVTMFVHLIVAIFCWAMWIPCRNFATALLFALIVGSLMGSIWPLVAPMMTRVVGLPKLSVTFGMVWVALGIFAIVSPIFGLELRTTSSTESNNYVKTAILSGFGYFGSALSMWILRGFLAARDDVALEAKTGFDDGELHLHVGFTEWMRGLFKFRGLSRKI